MKLLEGLRRIDQSAARMQAEDEVLSQWLVNYIANHRHRLACDLQLLQEHATIKHKILEFGSVPPLLLLASQEMGYDIRGLDIAPERFSQVVADCQLTIHKNDFEKEPVPFDDDTFDVVLFNEVFEHLRIDLIFTMSEVFRVMKPGATLLLSTPNLRSVRGLRNLLSRGIAGHVGTDLYDEHEKIKKFGHMGHVREYTSQEVSGFLSRVGFRTKRTIYRYNRSNTSRRRNVFSLFEQFFTSFIPSFSPMFTLVCEKSR